MVGDNLAIGSVGTNLHANNQVMLYEAILNPFSPQMIISNQNLDHLISYLRHYYRGISRSHHIVFSAITLAQLLLLNVPALSNLPPAEHEVALWWLVGYWILYMDQSTRSQAADFLSQAPGELQLNEAQSQIQNLHTPAAGILNLPDVISLFNNHGDHTFSTAQANLENVAITPYFAQVTYPGGTIVVIQLAGTYYIITPYNHFFTTASMETVLTILSQIARAQFLPRRVVTAVVETGFWSNVGATVGAVMGIPFVGLSLLSGSNPRAVITAYGVLITMSAAAFNFRFQQFGAKPTIRNDLKTKKDEL